MVSRAKPWLPKKGEVAVVTYSEPIIDIGARTAHHPVGYTFLEKGDWENGPEIWFDPAQVENCKPSRPGLSYLSERFYPVPRVRTPGSFVVLRPATPDEEAAWRLSGKE